MKLKELPNEEKPRERLIKYGANNISNEDLISILIRTGSKYENVKQLSNKILSKIKNINSLSELGIRELTSIKGIGTTKALTLLAAIELGKRVSKLQIEDKLVINNTDVVHEYFSNIIAYEKQENFLVILVDNKKRLIGYNKMFKGTDNTALISPKEVFNYAIKERASGIIIMHNHPSGILNPSNADIELTNNLIMAGKTLQIPILDHIITNGVEYYSFFNEINKEVVKDEA